MVYTVTFNPAIDYVIRLDALTPGAINRARQELIQFGGKGINVSTVLGRLGVDSVALGFLAGFTGQALEQELRRAGVRTDFLHLPDGFTRINVKIKAGEETELNGRGPEIGPHALEQLLAKLDRLVQGDVLVLAGSIPACLPDDIYQRLLSRLEGRGVLAVVDAEGALLRPGAGIPSFSGQAQPSGAGRHVWPGIAHHRGDPRRRRRPAAAGRPERAGLHGRGGRHPAG